LFCPDAFGWLYACRGLYQLQEYALVVEGLAAAAFSKSIRLGNDTDWQPLVELLLEQPKLRLAGATASQ
jgi:hypothetical protein